MDEIEIVKQLTEHDENIKSLKRRMDAQEKQSQALQNLAISVKELAINVANLNKNSEIHDKRLDEIESKPAKRWDALVTLIITALVSGIIGFLLTYLGLK